MYDPAGFDAELRVAVEEVAVGRWIGMRDLLRRTGRDWALRTSRSQVLGAAAARSDVVRLWLREEPESVDAVVMQARVAVQWAVRAHRRGHRDAGWWEEEARRVCRAAAQRVPLDPVPWVCLLALASLDTAVDVERRRPEHRIVPREPLLPIGPWGLLDRVNERDPGNREAYHHVLRFFQAQAGSACAPAIDFVRWVTSWAPDGSPLLVLPAYAHVERYRAQVAQGSRDPLLRRQWVADPVLRDTLRALTGWFDHAAIRGARSVRDLSYLAHALWAGCQYDQAGRVFAALGQHADKLPWAYVAETPELAETELRRARLQCEAASYGDKPRAGPRWRATPAYRPQ
ncbi:hypothetical protein [Streptomyces sp. Ru73]|uniref:hypothetical protein n=1 Tax=Streptomyces sp. Ru73 TaxID=2080748 RepID=UPI0021564951|nr:hypothetical protein [Streptomyces sp. Ru73]